MNGTSAATPMTAGVVALILQANPNLTYRDVRYILATTARKNDPTDSDWTQNGAGHWINHNYGFGAIDVGAAITAATSSSYQLLDTNITKSYVRNLTIATIDDTHPVIVEINVSTQDNMSVEFAELSVTNLLGQVEDLEIILQSPSETNSTLSHSNRILNYYGYDDIFADFTFGSVRYLDENSSGTWRLYITDTRSDAPGSQLDAITLTLHGRNPQ
jgi:kexin